ncbi:MAG: hypothetical protein MHPSP_000289 [Paramarteilia canceri]
MSQKFGHKVIKSAALYPKPNDGLYFTNCGVNQFRNFKKIVMIGSKNNVWDLGETGPMGPSIEIFIKGIEIATIVLVKYLKISSNDIVPLNIPNLIDVGVGLERLEMVHRGLKNMYSCETLKPFVDKTLELLNRPSVDENDINLISDKSRTILMCIMDGIFPGPASNE